MTNFLIMYIYILYIYIYINPCPLKKYSMLCIAKFFFWKAKNRCPMFSNCSNNNFRQLFSIHFVYLYNLKVTVQVQKWTDGWEQKFKKEFLPEILLRKTIFLFYWFDKSYIINNKRIQIFVYVGICMWVYNCKHLFVHIYCCIMVRKRYTVK